jgi:hypothetical protein
MPDHPVKDGKELPIQAPSKFPDQIHGTTPGDRGLDFGLDIETEQNSCNPDPVETSFEKRHGWI